MMMILQLVVVLSCVLGLALSSSVVGSDEFSLTRREAQEVAMVFVKQLSTNRANATQLHGILAGLPLSARVFELASSPAESSLQMSGEDLDLLSTTAQEIARFPVLHYLLNQYMLSKSSVDKRLYLQTLHLALSHGADVTVGLNQDPPLYQKAALLKDLTLVKDIFSLGKRSLSREIISRSTRLSAFLRMLYALPSDVVPIAKLLLHVEAITRRQVDSVTDAQQELNATAVAIDLLSRARLERPTLSPVLLMHESAHYRQLVEHIAMGHATRSPSLAIDSTSADSTALPVYLSQIISLRDISDAIVDVLQGIVSTLVDIVFDDKDEDCERRAVAIERFIELHTQVDEQDRNAFHFLAASNAVGIVEMLTDVLSTMTHEATGVRTSTDHSSRCAPTRTTSDAATATIGNNDSAAHALDHLRQKALMFWEALRMTDERGHSPLSYADTRYGPDSDISVLLRRFIGQLLNILSDDSLAVSSKEFSLQENELDVEVEVEEVLEEEVSVAGDGLATDPSQNNVHADSLVADEDGIADDGEQEDLEPRPSVPETETGGWRTDRLIGFGSSQSTTPQLYDRCDVLEVWDTDLPSAEEFFVRYVNTQTPVVFRGAALRANSSMAKLRQVFAKKRFIHTYGTVKVPHSPLPYAESFGVSSSVKTMREVANSDDRLSVPLYTFTTASSQWATKLQQEVPLPEAIQSVDNPAKSAYGFELQFYLGAAGTGAPVHFHGHAINTLAYGEKKWVMYPPNEGFYSTITALDYFQMLESYDHTAALSALTHNGTTNLQIGDLRKDSLQCTQYAGDIFYVPTMWAHGTLNTKQTIGVAHEFSVESFCME